MLLDELRNPRVDKLTPFEQYLLQEWVNRLRDPYERAMSHRQIRVEVAKMFAAWDADPEVPPR